MATIAVAGHNIKLGRGGIREIEFFAQTQQLILGGRMPDLRQRGTVAALDALCARAASSREKTSDGTEARLSLPAHARTPPADDRGPADAHGAQGAGRRRACRLFHGLSPTRSHFRAALTEQLETVQGHYARLFEREPELTATRGQSRLHRRRGRSRNARHARTRWGFAIRRMSRPRSAAGIMAAFAPRAAPGRANCLTKLVPVLLPALAATADPDAAFAQFDRFLSNLPAGVQLFSLLLARPRSPGADRRDRGFGAASGAASRAARRRRWMR